MTLQTPINTLQELQSSSSGPIYPGDEADPSDDASLIMPQLSQSNGLTHEAHDELNRLVPSTDQDAILPSDLKRDREAGSIEDICATKKQRTGNDVLDQPIDNGRKSPDPVEPSKKGIAFFNDNDVLSGRGGGTNVHPGNRNFRDLINLHRRAYLKARKNDKPAISRAIVKAIRQNNGRFLKKDEKLGLWLEIGDDAAREKTSQALRQRAPEMRKILFDTEREEARSAAEEHLRQQRMIMGMTASADLMTPGLSQVVSPSMGNVPSNNPMLNPALFAVANKGSVAAGRQTLPSDPYSRMFSAALLGGGIDCFPTNTGAV